MSTLNVNAIQNLSGVEKYLPTTWVNFEGWPTPVIRSCGNISSILDNDVGDFTIGFTVPFVALDYSPAGSWGRTSLATRDQQDGPIIIKTISSASYQMWLTDGKATARDGDIISTIIMR